MNESMTPDLISLTDEEGKEYEFEILDRIETDEARYVALLPVYHDANELLDDSGELVILKVVDDGEEEFLEQIEDDDEYETIAEAFTDRLQDLYEIEDK